MSVTRKTNVPEEMQRLKASSNTRDIMVGDECFEMQPLSLGQASEVLVLAAKSMQNVIEKTVEEPTLPAILTSMVVGDEVILQRLLAIAMPSLGSAQIDQITGPQAIHIVGCIMELNFDPDIVPGESMAQLERVMAKATQVFQNVVLSVLVQQQKNLLQATGELPLNLEEGGEDGVDVGPETVAEAPVQTEGVPIANGSTSIAQD